jgi:hypothetical protein
MARRGSPVDTTILLLLCATLGTSACARPLASPIARGGDGTSAASPESMPRRAPTSHVLEAYGRLPLHFEENQGQAHPSVRFLARTERGVVGLTPTGLVLGTSDGPVRLTFVTAAAPPRIEAADPLPGRVNHYRGTDRSRWWTGIATYARVRYEAVYPGIDVVVYGNQRRLEYDFVVAPGGDPGAIRVRVEGADAVALAGDDLVIHRGRQTIMQQAPVIYQERSGDREPVRGRYVLRGRDLGVAVEAHDRSRPLVIDPVIEYAAKIGPATARAIAVDAAGSAHVTGEATGSDGYPLVNPAFDPNHCCLPDIVVTKLTPNGDALVYSTFIGTQGPDAATGIAVDSTGNAWVTGWAGSPGIGSHCDFPTTPGAVMPAFCHGSDSSAGVIAKFSPTGALLYATYLGGIDTGVETLPSGACVQTRIRGLAVDGADNVYVVGGTQTVDFPTTPGAHQTARAAGPTGDYCHGDSAAFVTKLTSAGALAYSTYLDAFLRAEAATAVTVDAEGKAYVAGFSNSIAGSPGAVSSPPFPVKARLTPSKSDEGGFVVKLDKKGVPVHGTVIGPTPVSIDLGPDGSTYVAGAAPTDFATVNAVQPTPPGGRDGFAARLKGSGKGYVWSTYVGGSGNDVINGIAAGPDGNAWLVGSSDSSDFPTKDATIPKTSAIEVVVLQLSANGALLFGTPVGGGEGADVAMDSAGSAYLTGTGTEDFPTTPGAYASPTAGLFVVKYAAE